MQVEQGNPAILFAHFLKQSGEEATISGTPTITIRHYQHTTSSLDTDVSAQDMTLISGSLYYYKWAYTTIVKSQYAATFAATYNTGESVTGTKTFALMSSKIIGAVVGTWTHDEKDKVLKLMQQILSLIRDRKSLEALQSNLDMLVKDNKLQAVGDKNRASEMINDINNEFNVVKEELNSLREKVDLQAKMLTKMADPKILEEILNDKTKGNGS